jgi:CHAT domain-containing protein/Tfp pilus assembly protein PilF
MSEAAYGTTHPYVATSLDNLAILQRTTGNYEQARPLYERALKIREVALGPEHPDVAVSLNNLADLLHETGDYSGAKYLYERAIRINEKTRGTEPTKFAGVLDNLAKLLRDMGDYSSALLLHERGLKIREQSLGSEHPDVAISLNNLAEVKRMTGDYAGAAQLYERALKVKIKAVGEDHPDVAGGLDNLASTILALTADHEKAILLYQRALKIKEQSFGPDHPAVATTLNNIANMLFAERNYAAAQKHAERALRINESGLGQDHPDVAKNLVTVALLAWETGDVRQAAASFERAFRLTERHARQALSGLAERQRLAFLRTTEPYLDAYLSLPSTAVSHSMTYVAVLARKNLVFRLLAEERAVLTHTVDPTVRQLAERRTRLSQALAGLTFGTAGDVSSRRKRAEEIEREMEQVEAELSRSSASFRQEQTEAKADTAEVCQALPHGAALLDYVRYHRYTPRQGPQPGRWTDSYTVFVLRGGHCPEVQRFELGAAEPIDRAAKAFRQALAGGASETQLRPIAQALGALVLPSPVRATVASASTLLVAPDGPLALIPFALLPGEDGLAFLLETRVVATIPSGRDLLRIARKDELGKPAAGLVLVGNPDYGATVARAEDASAQSRSTSRAGCGLEAAAEFTPLLGTAEEVRAIASQASARLTGTAVRQAEGRAATEAWLSQQITGQRYVHLATHGYFAGEGCAPPTTPASRGVVVQARLNGEPSGPVGTNPLLLSGVALAGANRRAQAKTGADDGILTALEVTGLDLRGTDLVVLSACETGLGTQQTGQELLGLRWAFGMAGAKTLLTSLWKVPDEPTVRLMTKFYGYLWRSENDGGPLGKAAALRQAQLDVIKENRARFSGDSRPNDWGAWVLSGDWQ